MLTSICSLFFSVELVVQSTIQVVINFPVIVYSVIYKIKWICSANSGHFVLWYKWSQQQISIIHGPVLWSLESGSWAQRLQALCFFPNITVQSSSLGFSSHKQEVNVLLSKSSSLSKFDRKFPTTINSIFFSLTTKSLIWLEGGEEGNRLSAKTDKWSVFFCLFFFCSVLPQKHAVRQNERDFIQVQYFLIISIITRVRTLSFMRSYQPPFLIIIQNKCFSMHGRKIVCVCEGESFSSPL